MSYSVYMHTCPDGKVYIGATKQRPPRRWHGGCAYRSNRAFYAAIQFWGWGNIQHEILAEGLQEKAAHEMEARLIREHRSTDPQHGFNRAAGATTKGLSPTEEARRNISKGLTGKTKGRPHTKEHAAHIAQALRGHTVTEATRQKLRDAWVRRKQAVKE